MKWLDEAIPERERNVLCLLRLQDRSSHLLCSGYEVSHSPFPVKNVQKRALCDGELLSCKTNRIGVTTSAKHFCDVIIQVKVKFALQLANCLIAKIKFLSVPMRRVEEWRYSYLQSWPRQWVRCRGRSRPVRTVTDERESPWNCWLFRHRQHLVMRNFTHTSHLCHLHLFWRLLLTPAAVVQWILNGERSGRIIPNIRPNVVYDAQTFSEAGGGGGRLYMKWSVAKFIGEGVFV